MKNPTFINRDGMIADRDYINWLQDIKQRFRNAQLKAVVRVNTEMLQFYWSVGRDMHNMHIKKLNYKATTSNLGIIIGEYTSLKTVQQLYAC